jgi:hypothetical protein
MLLVDITLCCGNGWHKIFLMFLVDRPGEVVNTLFLTAAINVEIGGLKSAP